MDFTGTFSFLFNTGFWFKLFLGISFILIFGVSMYWFVSIHEQVHVNVAERNGCSTGDIQLLPDTTQDLGEFSLAFAGVNYTCPNRDVFQQVKGQQEMVDIVGYQLLPLYMILVLILLLQLVKLGLS